MYVLLKVDQISRTEQVNKSLRCQMKSITLLAGPHMRGTHMLEGIGS